MALLFFTIPAMVLAVAIALVPLLVSTLRNHRGPSEAPARPSAAFGTNRTEDGSYDVAQRAA